MVQAADFRELYDLAQRGEFDRPEVWSVLVEREMGTSPVEANHSTNRKLRKELDALYARVCHEMESYDDDLWQRAF